MLGALDGALSEALPLGPGAWDPPPLAGLL